MESKASSGQVLIECAMVLFVFAVLLACLLDFDSYKKRGHERITEKQTLNFSRYRNGK
jgi:hypothetical protein